MTIGIAHPPDWLNGNAYSVILALVYGYIPYFILPVFAGLDRIDRSQIEAARDLGRDARSAPSCTSRCRSAGRASSPASALVVLPMFGDYYTNDLISASPRTNMLGNEINLFVQGGPEKNLGASLVIVLMVILTVGMAYYIAPDRARRAEVARARAGEARCADRAPLARNPGAPRFLVLATWGYIAWALVPVGVAILFSFNAGRSRSVWQGFSIRWWWGDPSQSIFHDPDYTHALVHSLELAGLDMLIATPLGVLLALGLARWRGRGRGSPPTA